MDVRIFTKWFRLRGSEVAVVLVEKRGAHLCLVTNAWQAVDWDCIILQVGPTLLSTWDDCMGVKLSKKNVDGGRFGSYIGPNFLIPCRKRLYSLTKAVEPPFHINPISTYQNIGKSDFHIARRLFILTRPSCGPSPKLISVFDHHKKSVAILTPSQRRPLLGLSPATDLLPFIFQNSLLLVAESLFASPLQRWLVGLSARPEWPRKGQNSTKGRSPCMWSWLAWLLPSAGRSSATTSEFQVISCWIEFGQLIRARKPNKQAPNIVCDLVDSVVIGIHFILHSIWCYDTPQIPKMVILWYT